MLIASWRFQTLSSFHTECEKSRQSIPLSMTFQLSAKNIGVCGICSLVTGVEMLRLWTFDKVKEINYVITVSFIFIS